MKTVKEVSRLTGVSVRTLHHYDAIGLLKPSKVTEAGYRLYDDKALQRLHNILLFRALQFPLKEIKALLDSPISTPCRRWHSRSSCCGCSARIWIVLFPTPRYCRKQE